MNWDTTLFEGSFAAPGEEVPVSRVEECPGGKGANASVAASRLLGPGKVAFIGAVGDDDLGASLGAGLRSEGVLTDGLVAVRGRSGRAFIVVDRSGSKQIHTLFAANDSFSPRHLALPGPRRALSACEAVVVMDAPQPAALEAARMAKRAGARIFYSPGTRIGGEAPVPLETMKLADQLVLDRGELARLTSERVPRDGLRGLMRLHPHLVLVATLGSSGCLVARDRTIRAVAPFELGALGLRAVNTTGSGDAFLAAYACYSLSGLAPEEAASWGNLAGALKAASSETRGSPTRQALESAMGRFPAVRGTRPGSPSKRAASRFRRRS